MALYWSVFRDKEFVSVRGEGRITCEDIDEYLAATLRLGAKSYAKLVDLMGSSVLALDPDELDHVAESHHLYARGGGAGPVALVVHSCLNLDMALLIKQRVGDRPYRVFTSVAEARDWLNQMANDRRAALAPVSAEQPEAPLALVRRTATFIREQI